MSAYSRKPQTSHYLFAGAIVSRDSEHVSVRYFPAATLDVKIQDVDRIEETTDGRTMRSYVWIALRAGADLNANFRPRLARLAIEADSAPFVMGGFSRTMVPTALPSGGAPSIPPLVDAGGLSALAGRIPPDVRQELLRAAESLSPMASTTVYDTNSKTPQKTSQPTQSRTGDEGFHLDDGDDSKEVNDEPVDTTKDEKSDW